MCKSINKNTKFNLSRKDIVDTPNAFSVPPKINNAPFLNNSRIWNISNKEHYSEWFLEEISRIKRNVIHYYHNGRMIQKNHSDMYSNEFYDKLCSNLVEETNIVEAIYLSNGYHNKIGLEYAKGQLRRYEYETGKIPHSRQKLTSPIVNAIYKKLWTKFNVTTYNNLIEDLFGDVNKEFGVYLGESGLKRAIREAQDFFKQKGRLPTQNDKIYNKWQGSIRRGHWKEFGILTWNDFLMRCFDETNRKVNRYIGKQGLINAKDDILAYEEKYNEKPVSSTPEIYGIIGAIYRGEWTEEGIDGFQDILDYVYGKFDPKKEFETWKEKAMKFYKENGYPPRKYKDEEFKGLMLDLNQGRFLPIGLSNWTSFIERALNIDFKTYKRLVLKINRKSKKRSKDWKPHGYYRGTSGFENAIQVLKSKYLENKKFPYSSAKGLSGLYNAIRKGYYTEFGVSSWNEMKEYCITRWANEKLDLSSNINEYYS